MAIQTIQYQNKVALNTNPEIADINKVTDNDMNEIKSVVNNNSNELSNVFSNIQVITCSKTIGVINANTDLYDQTLDISANIPEGYIAIGIVGVKFSGGYYSQLALNRHYLSGNIIEYALKNTYTSATGSITIAFSVLCVKTNL